VSQFNTSLYVIKPANGVTTDAQIIGGLLLLYSLHQGFLPEKFILLLHV